MTTPGQRFYGTSRLAQPYTRTDVLAGRVVRLSPALITILDGRMDDPAGVLRRDVLGHVAALLDYGVRSFHLDILFGDYGGFGPTLPAPNAHIFAPGFVRELNQTVRARDAFLTVHLLTAVPARRLRALATIPLGAVCFQLDAVPEAASLAALVAQINDMGACASPVIETVGTATLVPTPPLGVTRQLAPVLPQIGMLTLQAAGTGARANGSGFGDDRVTVYLDRLLPGFGGTVQLQGGITSATTRDAVRTGAEFLVAGTQIFHPPAGISPQQVIGAILEGAAAGLGV